MTVASAMANTYYDNFNIKNFYKMDSASGYPAMRYYNDGGGTQPAQPGPYNIHSLGIPWGMSGAFGGYAGVADMEVQVFVDNLEAPVISNLTVSSVRDDSFLVNLTANEATSFYLEYGTSTGIYDKVIPSIDTFAITQQYRVGDNEKLLSNTTYYWRIRLEDTSGNIRYTTEQTTTTLEKLPRNNRPHKFGSNRLAAGYIGAIKAIR